MIQQPATRKTTVFDHPLANISTTSEQLTEAIGMYQAAAKAESDYLGKLEGEVVDVVKDIESDYYLTAEHKRLHKATKRLGNAVLKLLRA